MATLSPPRRPTNTNKRITYKVLEWQKLFDSSDMTISEWVQIAQTIEVARGGRGQEHGQASGLGSVDSTDPLWAGTAV